MGVTIHYNGTLASKSHYGKVVEVAMEFAEEHDLPFLLFGINPEPTDGLENEEGGWLCPIQGICLQPDPMCEPLILEFDEELHMEHFCKTQFADISVHLLVIDLLQRIEPFFSRFEVFDEGQYWEKRDLVVLQKKREFINEAIASIKKKQ